MAQGTHLYFDHPQEPDPEERGLYWATRYIDTRKTFGFMPDNIYGNADFKLTGDPITQKDLDMHALEHVPLKKVKNVIGKILIQIFMPQLLFKPKLQCHVRRGVITILFIKLLKILYCQLSIRRDCHGHDRMVLGFTITCAISAYHH